MTSDPGPVVQRARLTADLQRIRHDAGMTQEEVARTLDWSPSKLIRIEGGIVGVSTTDLQALLRHYGITDTDRVDAMCTLARGARARGWWDSYKNDLHDNAYTTYLGYENGASIIRWFAPLLIPGLLQTEEYARAVTIEYFPDSPISEIVLEVRLLRQQKLTEREDPPRQHFILDEAVIRRQVGAQRDLGIMRRQLEYLLATAEQPYVTVELIPFTKGFHFGLRGEFTILGFDSTLEDILYLENARAQGGDLTNDDSGQVALYLEAFEHIRKLALSEEQTVAFIRRAADEITEA